MGYTHEKGQNLAAGLPLASKTRRPDALRKSMRGMAYAFRHARLRDTEPPASCLEQPALVGSEDPERIREAFCGGVAGERR